MNKTLINNIFEKFEDQPELKSTDPEEKVPEQPKQPVTSESPEGINFEKPEQEDEPTDEFNDEEEQEQEQDYFEPKDISINTFAEKLNYISSLLKEKGYTDLKILIGEGWGTVVIDNKITDKTKDLLQELSEELSISLKVKTEDTPNGKMTTIKVKNKIDIETFKDVYDMVKKEKERQELLKLGIMPEQMPQDIQSQFGGVPEQESQE